MHFTASLRSQPSAEIKSCFTDLNGEVDRLAITQNEFDFVGPVADLSEVLAIVKSLSPRVVSQLDNFFQLVAASLVQRIDIFNGNRGIFAHADWQCLLEGAKWKPTREREIGGSKGIPLIQGCCRFKVCCRRGHASRAHRWTVIETWVVAQASHFRGPVGKRKGAGLSVLLGG